MRDKNELPLDIITLYESYADFFIAPFMYPIDFNEWLNNNRSYSNFMDDFNLKNLLSGQGIHGKIAYKSFLSAVHEQYQKAVFSLLVERKNKPLLQFFRDYPSVQDFILENENFVTMIANAWSDHQMHLRNDNYQYLISKVTEIAKTKFPKEDVYDADTLIQQISNYVDFNSDHISFKREVDIALNRSFSMTNLDYKKHQTKAINKLNTIAETENLKDVQNPMREILANLEQLDLAAHPTNYKAKVDALYNQALNITYLAALIKNIQGIKKDSLHHQIELQNKLVTLDPTLPHFELKDIADSMINDTIRKTNKVYLSQKFKEVKKVLLDAGMDPSLYSKKSDLLTNFKKIQTLQDPGEYRVAVDNLAETVIANLRTSVNLIKSIDASRNASAPHDINMKRFYTKLIDSIKEVSLAQPRKNYKKHLSKLLEQETNKVTARDKIIQKTEQQISNFARNHSDEDSLINLASLELIKFQVKQIDFSLNEKEYISKLNTTATLHNQRELIDTFNKKLILDLIQSLDFSWKHGYTQATEEIVSELKNKLSKLPKTTNIITKLKKLFTTLPADLEISLTNVVTKFLHDQFDRIIHYTAKNIMAIELTADQKNLIIALRKSHANVSDPKIKQILHEAINYLENTDIGIPIYRKYLEEKLNQLTRELPEVSHSRFFKENKSNNIKTLINNFIESMHAINKTSHDVRVSHS